MIQQIHSGLFIQRKWKHQLKDIYDAYVHYSIIYNNQDMQASYVLQ